MRLMILSFVGGVLALQFLPWLPHYSFIIAFLAATALACLSVGYFLPTKKTLCFLSKLVFVAALGFSWASLYAHSLTDWTLPKNLEGKNIVVEGYVASLPKTDAHHMSFTFRLDSRLRGNDTRHVVIPEKSRQRFYPESTSTHLRGYTNKPQKVKLLLSWYNNYPIYPTFKAGDKWRLTVRLKRPHSSMNPGGFDYEAYLLEKKIRATGYVVADTATPNQCLSSDWYRQPINRLRQYLETKIKAALKDKPLNNLIIALVVGDQSGISEPEWQVFRSTGTIHFVVIAGLHIGFVAGLLFFLGQFIWRRIPRAPLALAASQVGAISALSGAYVYSALAGFSIPTQRALIMLSVFLLGALLRRNLQAWQALLLSLFIVVLLDPLAGLSAGFWLSFLAVALIIYTLSARLVKPRKWQVYWRLQITLTLGLIPLILLMFQQAPLISFFANLLTIPLLGFIVIPLSLSGALLLFVSYQAGRFLLLLAEKSMQLIWHGLTWAAGLPLANWQHYVFNGWVLASALIGFLLLLSPRGFPRRWLGLFWLLPLCFYKPPAPPVGMVWFTLLDVGQGLSAVIQTKQHVLIYDTGPKFYSGQDAGAKTILPFLASQGINKIDSLVISHGDADHSGGAKSLLSALPIATTYTSVPERFVAFHAKHCYAGQTWQWDGVNFTFLHPRPNTLFFGNNASCVLKVSAGKNSILLTGDIEEPVEDYLVAKHTAELNAKILVAPHHGSNTSSSPTFIQAAHPKYALFATGYLNAFHFPSPQVRKRYLENNVSLLNTPKTGAITFKFNAKSVMLLPKIYRMAHRRYWYGL